MTTQSKGVFRSWLRRLPHLWGEGAAEAWAIPEPWDGAWPDFLDDWLFALDPDTWNPADRSEDDEDDDVDFWERCRAFLLADAGLSLEPQEELGEYCRETYDDVLIWKATAFTSDLAIVTFHSIDVSFPVGLVRRGTLEASLKLLLEHGRGEYHG